MNVTSKNTMKFLVRLTIFLSYLIQDVLSDRIDAADGDEDPDEAIEKSDKASLLLRRNVDQGGSGKELMVVVGGRFRKSKWHILFSFVAACVTIISVISAWMFSLFILRGFVVIAFTLIGKVLPRRPGKDDDYTVSDCSSPCPSEFKSSLHDHPFKHIGYSSQSASSSRSSNSWDSFMFSIFGSRSSRSNSSRSINSWTPTTSTTCSLSSSVLSRMLRYTNQDSEEEFSTTSSYGVNSHS